MKNVNYKNQSLPIKEFKMNSIKENAAICIIAKRGSGKSVLCRDILGHYNNIPGGVIISQTEKMNAFYGKFFPTLYIHYTYKSEILEKLLYRQKNIIAKCKKKYREGKRVDPRAFLIMDDCLSSKGEWAKDEKIAEIFFNGRHYQLIFILTMQFPLGVKPEYRTNFDYIFLLADDTFSNQKRIYDHYAGIFPSLELFKQVFKQLTDNYGCMVIVNRGPGGTLLDKVFHYKAKLHNKIEMIGSKQFIQYHHDNYDIDWDNHQPKFDINNFVPNKKNKKVIHVSKN